MRTFKFISARPLWVKISALVGIPILVMAVSATLLMRSVNQELILTQARDLAQTVANQVITDRKHYVESVVRPLKGSDFAASEGYEKGDAHVPLPATFVMGVAEDVSDSQDRYDYRLVSRWNINPGNKLDDDFLQRAFADLETQEREAKVAGRLTPTQAFTGWSAFSETASVRGKPTLRFVAPDPAVGASCVSCHNKLEGRDDIIQLRRADGVAPGKTFALNDLMGAIAVDVNLESVGNVAQAGFFKILGLVGLLATGALLITPVIARRLVSKPLSELATAAERVAEGDFTHEVARRSEDEVGALASSFTRMKTGLADVIRKTATAAAEVTAASTEIAAANEEMAAGMENQQRQTGQVSTAVEEMAVSIGEVAKKASDASSMSSEAGQQASEGGEVVSGTIDGMNAISQQVNDSAVAVGELGKRGEQIGQIIAVINDIADQTNLLALNAAIEAARAGEHGRGFAVVADEVRKLAERTTKATEEVGESIKAIQEETTRAVERMGAGTARVDEGVALANQAGEALSRIVDSSKSVAGMIQSIAAAADEQNTASNEIRRNVEAINTVTSESAKGVQRAAAAAGELSAKAEQLQSLVGRFNV